MISIAGVVAATTVAITPQALSVVTANEGTSADLELDTLAVRSSMYASDGTFLNLLTDQYNRKPIRLDEVPQEVIDAILAVEDADFYEHDGVNARATFRALVANVNAGGIAQGGSTITQQLVKNAILTSEQTVSRKTTEAFYALRLERQMTKDEILERYLNTVYFGAGASGVQAAAETYWNYTSADQMGWPEAAMLAGLIRLPNDLDPTRFPAAARERRSVVLQLLVREGHITQEQADEYETVPLPAERQEPLARKPTDYFVQEALEQVLNNEAILGGDSTVRRNAVYEGGLKIYTTLDPVAQEAAERARDENVPDASLNCYTHQRENNDPDGNCLVNYTAGVATVDTHTGAVRAIVGGPEFQKIKHNVTIHGKGRQPGSTMKTFVLAALFENGYTPSDQVRTSGKCTFPNPGGTPDPYIVDRSRGFRNGVGSIASATRASNNCAFVRLGLVVGQQTVIDVVERLGINTSRMEPHLSLPLGVSEILPMEMASAYAAFANDGVYNEPWYIERIEDHEGNVIYQHRPNSSRAVSVQTARLIAEVLESNVARGTGKRAHIAGHHAAGKTGTTDDKKDAWFVGFTDYYTTAVWIGDPGSNKYKIEFKEWGGRGGYGSEIPAQLWGQYMTEIHEGLESAPFGEPEPYRGGRFLRAPGEIDVCDLKDLSWSGPTVLTDADGDGKMDCGMPVTTETTADPGGGGRRPPTTRGGPPTTTGGPPPTPDAAQPDPGT